MNQLFGQQDPPCLRHRHGRRAKVLSKQPAQLSLPHAQTVGEVVDTRVIEGAAFDQRKRARYRVGRAAPGGKFEGRFPAGIGDRVGSPLPAPPRRWERTSCSRASAYERGRPDGNRSPLSCIR